MINNALLVNAVETNAFFAPGATAQDAKFTLATDLDGTLLGGSSEHRERLVTALACARTIFVTGRAIQSVRPLLSDPTVPTPAFIIADVGSTVVQVDGSDLRPVEPIQSIIEAAWPGTRRVLKALRRFHSLIPQHVPQARRCSYYIDDLTAVTPEFEEAVRNLGCDLLVSDGRYLDVLPRGVSKGSTLRALTEYLGMDPEEVIVAGDTLNDLSMFSAGFSGVVVGNAERQLVERLAGKKSVYFARSEGASGILEALSARGLVESNPVSGSRPIAPQQLMILYHRLPTDRKQSPNGIIPTLLGFFADGQTGAWVGWTVKENTDDFEESVVVSPAYPGLVASRIALTSSDVERFYQRFSKEALWPVLFSFPSYAEFSHEGWEHFLFINRLFAERAAREAAPSALVWIHDYNLWMAPRFLRELRPDLQIAFFHHTAFPAADIFNMLPWREQIIDSLLSCDYVGFHIPRYVENFVDVVRSLRPLKIYSRVEVGPRFSTRGSALGVETMATEIEVNGQVVRLGAHPIGIDMKVIRSLLREPEIQARVVVLREQLRGCMAIVSVDRLDYVKGCLQKVQAFERLLEMHPEFRGKVVLVNIVTPPSAGMTVHDKLRAKLELAVGRINGKFGSLEWTPIRYLARSVPFEEVVALYAACDIAWITPLRDGLNLVAKEYVAAKSVSGTEGVLILSEFAGAAVELDGALLTNPYDGANMLQTLLRALKIDPEERRERQARLSQIIEQNDVRRWGDQFLEAASRRSS